MIDLDLPYPPTVNTYWRKVGNRTLISKKGRTYRRDLVISVAEQMPHLPRLNTRLEVSVTAYPPDNRRRDLDNVLKALLDGMQHAGVYQDDSQIDHLAISRGTTQPEAPRVHVRILERNQ